MFDDRSRKLLAALIEKVLFEVVQASDGCSIWQRAGGIDFGGGPLSMGRDLVSPSADSIEMLKWNSPGINPLMTTRAGFFLTMDSQLFLQG